MEKLVLFFVVAYFGYSQGSVVRENSEPLTPELVERQNIEERSGKFEGDIVLTKEQRNALDAEISGERNAILNISALWPDNLVVYEIAPNYFTDDHITAIRVAIATIELVSCLKFKIRTNEANYIRITGLRGGCYSYVGRTKGAQTLNLTPAPVGRECFRHGTIVHEFLHALGFYHMQSTTSRDQWVNIIWGNIQEGAKYNFQKFAVNELGQNYDYGSVLHYGEYAFSINNQKTIVAKKNTQNLEIGQRWAMSKTDVIRLNKLYKCKLPCNI